MQPEGVRNLWRTPREEVRASERESYRDTSLTRNQSPPGSYNRPTPSALWCSWGVLLFLMSEAPLKRAKDKVRDKAGERKKSYFSASQNGADKDLDA